MIAAVLVLALVVAAAPAHASDDVAKAELDALLARARLASAQGDAHGAAQTFGAIATFYRRGGDRRSAAVADLEAACVLTAAGHWDDATAVLAQRRNVDAGPVLEDAMVLPLLVLEWGALIALVVFLFRRGGSRDG